MVTRKQTYKWSEIKPSFHSKATFLPILVKLYEGNGWIVSQNQLKGAEHADILLSYPSNPTQVALIINISFLEKPLSFLETRTILKELESLKSGIYSCNQFAIISIAGFDEKCNRLKEHNLLLQDEEHIKSLIRKYSETKRKEPEIQLFAHNQNTYEKVTKLFKRNKRVAVVQATGTGKTYLIAKLLSDYKGSARLVMAPSHYIIEQIKNHIRWESENIIFMTYDHSMYQTIEALSQLKLEFIVLDEFHRCGAEEWGRGVQEILNAYPKAKVFGTSATPIRYLDGGRDMSMEIFDGVVAENLSLSQSIVKKILPMPKYVTALYSLKEETENLSQKIYTSRQTSIQKENLINKLEVANINWERTKGISDILKKYIQPGMNKFIVFCKENEHINEMEQSVSNWFKEAFPKVKVINYRVTSAESDRSKNLKNFMNGKGANTVHLLFSIDMLNEGLHIEDVNGVILLRPTESPTIFYQQIGRCLKVGFKGQPVIFDFVNNFRSIRTNDFLSDLQFFRQNEKNLRNELGLEEICPPFTLYDEVKEITEVFGQIRFFTNNWEAMFQHLVEYKERFGNCKVPHDWNENIKLRNWVVIQRAKQFDMLPERKKKLDQIGFIWKIHEDSWIENYKILSKYFEKNGHCLVTKKENYNMYQWCKGQRRSYRSGKITPLYKNMLDTIYFDWDPEETNWEYKFKEYAKFLKKGLTEKELYQLDYRELQKWVLTQRMRKRRNDFQVLTKERVDRLTKIGMSWNPESEKFEIMFNKLIQYKSRFGNCRVPAKWSEDPLLGFWINNLRSSCKTNKLSQEKIELLNNLGMEWNPLTTINAELWERKFKELENFKKINGHCNIATDRGELGNWLSKHRQYYKKGTINPEHKERLTSLGVEWEVAHKFVWERNYKALLEFNKEFGHCNVPGKNALPQYKKLGNWVGNQRTIYKSGKMSQDKIVKLEAVGIDWYFKKNELDENLRKHLENLNVFKQEFGHANVADRKGKYKALSTFLQHQKSLYKKGRLDLNTIELLEKAGIEWDLQQKIADRWYEYFELLKNYKEKYGSTNVKKITKDLGFEKLGFWVQNQRTLYKLNKLSSERITLLEGIGFEWTLIYQDEEIWKQRVKELKEFKKQYGDCQVPQTFPDNPQLGNWMISVRSRYRKGKLSPKKIKELESLGFPWKIGKGSYWKVKAKRKKA
jgi:superfamily II DNA or RNA helicase